MISGIQKCGKKKTAHTAAWSEAGQQTGADRYYYIPARNTRSRVILASNHNRFGKMWECPDFFRLDGKWVLLTSPQDMLPKGFEYHNGNGTLCLIGEYDEETGTFTEQHDQAIDYGIDFYATQTILTPTDVG